MPRVFKKGWLKKRTFWFLLLKPMMRRAAAIHCTSEAEREACEKLGLQGPFVIAPLGVHLPEMSHPTPTRSARDSHTPQSNNPTIQQSNNSLRVLFLGRLSEEKGLINLLEAWHQLQQEKKIGVENRCTKEVSTSTSNFDSKLLLAGPDWDDYKKVLDAKIAADHIENVEFAGPVHGEAKDKLYREADLFVLPSPMENFSMVVLEALAYGVPVIATKGTPWRELESEKCGCWIDQGVTPLREALSQLLHLSASQLHALGVNGRALAERRYQWSAVSDKLLSCYSKSCRCGGAYVDAV